VHHRRRAGDRLGAEAATLSLAEHRPVRIDEAKDRLS
jgi:hypothetical protein